MEEVGWFASRFILEACTRGSVVLLGAGVICQFATRLSPADRHRLTWSALWMTTLLAAAMAVIPTSATPGPVARATGISMDPSREPALPNAVVEFPAPPSASLLPAPPVAESTSHRAFGLHLSSFQTQVIAIAWLAGTLFLLARLGYGWRSLNRLQRSATSLTDPSWQTLLSQLRSELGIQRPVVLAVSSLVRIPLTVGTRCPAILLPESSIGWHERRRQAVLLHELSHIRRWDCGVQNMVYILCSILWFHPLAWLAKARMRLEREFACDASVLDHGLKPSEYAGELLDLTSPAPHHTPVGAVAMAHPALISRRIQTILNPAHRRRKSRPLVAGGVAAMLFLAAAFLPQPFALAIPAPPASTPTPVPTPETSNSQPPNPESPQVQVWLRAVQAQEKEVRDLKLSLKQLGDGPPSLAQTSADGPREPSGLALIEHLGLLRMEIVSRRAVYRANRDRLRSLPPQEQRQAVTDTYRDDALVQQAARMHADADLAWRSAKARHGEDSPEARLALKHREQRDQQLSNRVEGILTSLDLQIESARDELADVDQELERSLNQSSEHAAQWPKHFEAKRRLEREELMLDVLNRKLARARFLDHEARQAQGTNSPSSP